MNYSNKQPLFRVGRLEVAAEARRILTPDDLSPYLTRHERGDWGEYSEDYAAENSRNLMLMGITSYVTSKFLHGSNATPIFVMTTLAGRRTAICTEKDLWSEYMTARLPVILDIIL